MDEHNDVRDFDKAQIVMAWPGGVRAPTRWQVLGKWGGVGGCFRCAVVMVSNSHKGGTDGE